MTGFLRMHGQRDLRAGKCTYVPSCSTVSFQQFKIFAACNIGVAVLDSNEP
jgi:hypothetical protein